MRSAISLGFLALSLCPAQTERPTVLQSVACDGSGYYTIDVAKGTWSWQLLRGIEPTRDTCAVKEVLPLAHNQAALLIDTQRLSTLDDKTTFDLALYALPSWKLTAKKAVQGKQGNSSYIVPAEDGKSVVLMEGSDKGLKSSLRFDYLIPLLTQADPASAARPVDFPADSDLDGFLKTEARSELQPFLSSDKELLKQRSGMIPGTAMFLLGSGNHPGLGVVRPGNRLTLIQWEAPYGWSTLSDSGDAVLVQVNDAATTDKVRMPSGKLVVYSADTGKETALMIVPALATEGAKCIALWHGQLAVFVIPKGVVIVDFGKQSFKIVPFGGKIDSELRPVWVER